MNHTTIITGVALAGALSLAGLAGPSGPAARADQAAASRPAAGPVAGQHAATRSQPATPASDGVGAAATRCPRGWFCVWPKANFGGTMKGGTKRGTCYSPFKPAGHSVSNQTGRTIRVYSRVNCKGSHFDLRTRHYSNPTPFAVRSVWIR